MNNDWLKDLKVGDRVRIATKVAGGMKTNNLGQVEGISKGFLVVNEMKFSAINGHYDAPLPAGVEKYLTPYKPRTQEAKPPLKIEIELDWPGMEDALDNYKIIAVRPVKTGEYFINDDGNILLQGDHGGLAGCYPILQPRWRYPSDLLYDSRAIHYYPQEDEDPSGYSVTDRRGQNHCISPGLATMLKLRLPTPDDPAAPQTWFNPKFEE